MLDNSCQGCNKSGFCDFQMNGTTEDCPCIFCIVKMMCSEICDNFDDFHKQIFKFRLKNLSDNMEEL